MSIAYPRFAVLLAGLLLCGVWPALPQDPQKCLPVGIKPDDVVSTQRTRSAAGGDAVKKITVLDTLAELKASCQDGRLFDGNGREIRFYQLKGCWGNPPADYQEILAAQRKELDALKAKYTVVEMTCNPSGSFPY
jgi:hypothetical protein